jgi:uncharacterized protein (TIGR02594 family)
MTTSARIYSAALHYIGVHEVDGPESNPTIRRWIKQAASWLDGDDSKTAWCGCFRGALGLETATGVPKNHFRAASWLEWGMPVKSVSEAVQGDTVILKRPGGHHVGLFASYTGTKLTLLGGNQGNSVNLSAFSTSAIVGIRRG